MNELDQNWLSPGGTTMPAPQSTSTAATPSTTFDFSAPSAATTTSSTAANGGIGIHNGVFAGPGDGFDIGNSFAHPFVPQDLWQMPMTLEWDWANMTGYGDNSMGFGTAGTSSFDPDGGFQATGVMSGLDGNKNKER
jgi:hypothetical protein